LLALSAQDFIFIENLLQLRPGPWTFARPATAAGGPLALNRLALAQDVASAFDENF
jgi:hypothetical protein